jgi:hypothetical protein
MAQNSAQDDTTNWDMCILCQHEKKKEKCRSTEQGIETLSDMLLKFYQLKKLDYRLSGLCENEKDLNETLKLRKAKYHSTCKIFRKTCYVSMKEMACFYRVC